MYCENITILLPPHPKLDVQFRQRAQTCKSQLIIHTMIILMTHAVHAHAWKAVIFVSKTNQLQRFSTGLLRMFPTSGRPRGPGGMLYLGFLSILRSTYTPTNPASRPYCTLRCFSSSTICSQSNSGSLSKTTDILSWRRRTYQIFVKL